MPNKNNIELCKRLPTDLEFDTRNRSKRRVKVFQSSSSINVRHNCPFDAFKENVFLIYYESWEKLSAIK